VRNIGDDSVDLYYCKDISTIVLSFERVTRKWGRYKELAEILRFGETGKSKRQVEEQDPIQTRTRKTGECGTPSALCSTRQTELDGPDRRIRGLDR